MAKSQTRLQNVILFNAMNKGIVKCVLFVMVLFLGWFSAIYAQGSITVFEDTTASNTTKHYPPHFNRDGSINIDTIFNRFDVALKEYFGFDKQEPLELDSLYKLEPDSLYEEDRAFVKHFLNDLFSDEYVKIQDPENRLGTSSPDSIASICFKKLESQLIVKRKLLVECYSDNQRLRQIIVLVGCVILLVLLVVITFCIYRKRKKAKTGIVVRNVTTNVLRKQSLDDIVNNGNYLIIEGKEFSDNTAIRKIYIKNECIKGIYEMYAEDIRKSENPNENGCMILGRWVYNQDDDKYDVSLEELVFPDNDAVFSQYEISFGGIIKMKIFDRLRQLRQENDLQYDVTCWVHSHPNLGVFFSKADCNAHLQLKQSSHPRFLTAFVVDILTPSQELGIFTFQQNGNINSRAELKRLYSLKEWYEWALESECKSIRNKDYYNTLTDTKNHVVLCQSIHISDKAMRDVCEVAVNNDETFQLLYGSSSQNSNGETEFMVDILCRDFVVSDKELVGAFVVDLYCSIPSVRKAVADYMDKIKFVLVYSTSNKILTSIPVINNDLCEEISCYGEQKLEDLILWTER